MFIDAHCHLDQIGDERKLSKIIETAKQKGVLKMISCAGDYNSSIANIAIGKKFDCVLPCIGLYPVNLLELNEEEMNKAFKFFDSKLKLPAVAGIGEVGLDYKFAHNEQREKQKEIFRRFIQLSNNHNKPIVVHSRRAQKPAIRLLEEEKAEKVLMHSFTESSKLMRRAVDNGYFVSAGLAITFNEEFATRIVKFPLENILLETDSPIKFEGKQGFPEKIIDVAKKVAELKEIELETVEKHQEQNFNTLFD